jgi:CHAD domain-containing protein
MNATAHPLETLRKHLTELEAAILLCLDDPAKRPVHRLRTMTRRVEAQFTLLDALHVSNISGNEAQRARRLLKKLRRAAGRVRDLDVQDDLIAENTPPKSRDEAAKLREKLKQQRTEAADQLKASLQKNHTRLTITLEALLNTLETDEPPALTSTELLRLTTDWFTAKAPVPTDDPDDLHTIRKTAKIARYLAENAPKQARAPRKLAAEFELLQQIGGDWHDWLILSEIARDQMGESSPLTAAFTRRCLRSLSSYRKRLKTALPKAAEPPRA